MKTCAGYVSALLWLLPLCTVLAQPPTIESLIDGLLDEEGRAYEEAREAILSRPDIVDAAWLTRESTPYGPATWRRLVLTEALAMHVTHPNEARRLRSLQGLDNEHYRLRREPFPSVVRELRTLRHVAPLMMELFMKGTQTYGWSSPAAAEAEAAALHRDLLMAIGRSGHAASVHFLADVIEGGCGCCDSCDTALAALGETGTLAALPRLLRALNEARELGDPGKQAVAISAIGGLRHAEAWPLIEAELSNADPHVQRAAVRSAAVYGSRRHWLATPNEGVEVRSAIGFALVEALVEAKEDGIVLEILESLGAVATPELRDLLERRQAAVSDESFSEGLRTRAAGRFRQALDRVDMALARRQKSPR